jgi:hypothetical protein
MKPKYGFTNRTEVIHNYTAPVRLNKQEWVYARCHLPFNPTPNIGLHFHALPLPKPSVRVHKKSNIIFIQIDAIGRQSMYDSLNFGRKQKNVEVRTADIFFSTFLFSTFFCRPKLR